MKRILGSIIFLVIISNQANARCVIDRMLFRPHENDSHTTSVNTDRNCNITYTNGSALFIESASVLTPPKVGKMERTGELRHRYVKKAGFVGRDSLTMRVCGNFRGKSGCSKLTYNFDIR